MVTPLEGSVTGLARRWHNTTEHRGSCAYVAVARDDSASRKEITRYLISFFMSEDVTKRRCPGRGLFASQQHIPQRINWYTSRDNNESWDHNDEECPLRFSFMKKFAGHIS